MGGGGLLYFRKKQFLHFRKTGVTRKNHLTEADHIWAQNTQAVLHHTATPPGGVAVLGRYVCYPDKLG